MKVKRVQSKVGRNDPCPCGSGRKFKKCCLRKGRAPEKPPESLKEEYLRRYQIRLKEPKDIAGIRRAGKLVLETLDRVAEAVRPGVTTGEINALVHEHTLAANARPAPLNYRGFPKSSCVSVNEVICHGIPGDRVLADGDIVNVDVTSVLDGYYADANRTFFAGAPSPDARAIVHVARESLRRGMEMIRPGNTVGDIGWAIQTYAEGEGCS
ncbi:MAG: type I methionyl aminopeptidase, partial [Thermodesulfobacteriota bacterium]